MVQLDEEYVYNGQQALQESLAESQALQRAENDYATYMPAYPAEQEVVAAEVASQQVAPLVQPQYVYQGVYPQQQVVQSVPMDQMIVRAPQGMMNAQVSNPVVMRPGISPGVAAALNQIETESLTAAEKQMIEAETAENLNLQYPRGTVLPGQVPVMGLS